MFRFIRVMEDYTVIVVIRQDNLLAKIKNKYENISYVVIWFRLAQFIAIVLFIDEIGVSKFKLNKLNIINTCNTIYMLILKMYFTSPPAHP